VIRTIIICFVLFAFSECARDDYKYRIIGKVNTENGLKDAVWYTDTFSFDYDTIYYVNSDSSVVRIQQPYEIEKLK
jgi:hypothetical protein